MWPVGRHNAVRRLQARFSLLIPSGRPLEDLLLPGTFKTGIAYYTSTLSFDQDPVGKCTVQLIFRGEQPDWVRVYECEADGSPRLLRNLKPVREDHQLAEYVDVAEKRNAQSARVYLFRRSDSNGTSA